jgi:hypothetical protein
MNDLPPITEGLLDDYFLFCFFVLAQMNRPMANRIPRISRPMVGKTRREAAPINRRR